MANKSREQNQGKGRNLGQGLAGIADQERRDLAPSGDDAPTKDQSDRLTSGEQGHRRTVLAKSAATRAIEVGSDR